MKKAITEGKALFGDQISEDYAHDELALAMAFPDVLVIAACADEIVDTVRLCNKYRVPLVVRGSGTGLCGAAVASGGLLLDLSGMNRVLELDEDNLCIRVEPGIMLMELTEYVESRGLFYPPDPGEKTATIAGNISTNAGGMRAVKYGVTRDYVRELEVVTGSGDRLTLGGRVAKNSSGYSLKDLIVGSEGTLAVILSATLKLLPLPTVIVSLLLPYDDIQSAIETVPKLMRSKCAPTAVEFFERSTLLYAEDYLGKKFPDSKSAAYLLLTFDGQSESEVEREYTEAAELCIDAGALDAFIIATEERRDAVWSARGAFLEAIKASAGGMDECDVVVPRAKVADFIVFSHEIERKLGIRLSSFGHAGDGNLHIYLCRDKMPDTEYREKLAEAFRLLYEKARELRGKVSGEHGIGLAKKDWFMLQEPAVSVGIMRSIKSAFDKNYILNPGKIFD
ncbi:MAG: FAD-binding oxidoreductase [Oscillospiraceae bacterium]|nr:FAD-binding oxidoreductase [Oscillospiraceae bacterium]